MNPKKTSKISSTIAVKDWPMPEKGNRDRFIQIIELAVNNLRMSDFDFRELVRERLDKLK